MTVDKPLLFNNINDISAYVAGKLVKSPRTYWKIKYGVTLSMYLKDTKDER